MLVYKNQIYLTLHSLFYWFVIITDLGIIRIIIFHPILKKKSIRPLTGGSHNEDEVIGMTQE